MFGRKKKKQEEPKSYLRCPYCGHAPIIVTGKCTYHNPRHTVYRYECVLKCLQGEVCWTAEDAFNSWIRAVARLPARNDDGLRACNQLLPSPARLFRHHTFRGA